MCEILLFTPFSPLPRPTHPFSHFPSPLLLFSFPILSHIFLYRSPPQSGPLKSSSEIWGSAVSSVSPAANAFLRHYELRKLVWLQQLWDTFFCRRSKNFKCRGYWQSSGNMITRLVTNAWDFKPPAYKSVKWTSNAWVSRRMRETW